MRGNRADGRDLFADYVAASKLLNLRAGTFFSNFENFFLGVAKGKWTATTHWELLLRRDVFAQRCMSAERNVRLRCTLARRLVWTALVCSVTQGAGIRGRAVWNDAGHSCGGSVVAHNGSFHMLTGDFIGGINANGQPSGRDFRIDYAVSESASVEGPYAMRGVISNNAQAPQVVAQTFANGSTRFVLFQSPGGPLVSASPAGPFVPVVAIGWKECSEPAPLLYNGTWFVTCQCDTLPIPVCAVPFTIRTAPALEGPWSLHSTIGLQERARDFGISIEDPNLFVDKRGWWHILYHAVSGAERLLLYMLSQPLRSKTRL